MSAMVAQDLEELKHIIQTHKHRVDNTPDFYSAFLHVLARLRQLSKQRTDSVDSHALAGEKYKRKYSDGRPNQPKQIRPARPSAAAARAEPRGVSAGKAPSASQTVSGGPFLPTSSLLALDRMLTPCPFMLNVRPPPMPPSFEDSG